MQLNRDQAILKHMIRYCDEISQTVDTFGNSKDTFASNFIYQNAVALCVLQIGELTSHLTDEFKASHMGMPWNQIKAMRNIVAHNYGNIDIDILWDTVQYDIPSLKKYCLQYI